MAARRRQNASKANAALATNDTNRTIKSAKKEQEKKAVDDKIESNKLAETKAAYLAPLPLVMIVLLCSGFLWMLAFRDVMATGRPILGAMDEAMLLFTKSTSFFDDRNGFKSSAGGLSTIKTATTDENNMGGLFVRKVGGAAAIAVHSQKLIPLLFQPGDAYWKMGHFNPMLYTAILGNMAIATFYIFYLDDLKAAGAGKLSMTIVTLLMFEAAVMLSYVLTAKQKVFVPAKSSSIGSKSPSSVTNRIVSRTVAIVSSAIGIIACRDLFFPGQILSPIPRDDIYLEWTGAFFHSPPADEPESEEYELEAPLFIGDKFVSQYLGLNMLIMCLFKFTSAFMIKYGRDRSGPTKCKIIWRAQALGQGLVLFLFRLFTPAAKSASLDLRWHLMMLAYEAFILGLYGYF
uniref:Uncharacterized protein n=1 Tax=Ditylum brightwellii TaxID=49249 RepID=A0A6U3QH34_9STRA|mmetsp:Transcript_18929/g.28238  ORF Transcript_18929/g.28238 Transcript_18929/m.28238 type:complete len:404 (+) Transcript_18929:89-1300(+)